MSITFRLACPILITPMMCLLVGVAAVQDSEPAAADTAGLLEKGFSNLPTTRRVTDVAGATRHARGKPRCSSGSLTCPRRTRPARARAAARAGGGGRPGEHAPLPHAAAAVDAADRDALAAQAQHALQQAFG